MRQQRQREEETQPSSVAITVPFRNTTTTITSPPVMKPTSIHHHHHHHHHHPHPLAEHTLLLLYPSSTQYRHYYRTTPHPSLTVSSSIPTPRFITSFRSPTNPSIPSSSSSSKTSNINNKKTPLVKTNDNIVNNDHCHVSSSVDNYNYFEEEVQPTNPTPTKPNVSSSDQAFFLLTFIACTATASFTGFVMAAVPTLFAMSRTATALAKLADTAREELPSTMAAIRLSGMEISDLTLELSDLSQEISDGVNKSAQAVQAAEAGVRQIGSLARHKTMSMIEERANLPVISIQPVVAGVAKKTSQAVGHASKTFMNMITGGDSDDSTVEDGRPDHVDTLES